MFLTQWEPILFLIPHPFKDKMKDKKNKRKWFNQFLEIITHPVKYVLTDFEYQFHINKPR